MKAIRAIIVVMAMIALSASSAAARTVVTDAADGEPLVSASVFSNSGAVLALTDGVGVFDEIDARHYPLTIKCLGYEPVMVAEPVAEVAMQARAYELPEVVYNPKNHEVMHMVCYAREYMSAYIGSDTTIVYAEHMADMLYPVNDKVKFKGDKTMRELLTRNVARFVRNGGVDSVATNVEHDLFPLMMVASPAGAVFTENDSMASKEYYRDSIPGKSGIAFYIKKTPSEVSVTRDYMAEKPDHKWSPWILKLLGMTMDFKEMRSQVAFVPNAESTKHEISDISVATYGLEAICRGKMIKRFFATKEYVDLRSYLELYPVEIEYLSVEEAKALKKNKPEIKEFTIAPQAMPIDEGTQRMLKAAGR
ncbi:MAG: hypothetical protein ACI30K_07255 [Muribaculaceae bacterium]